MRNKADYENGSFRVLKNEAFFQVRGGRSNLAITSAPGKSLLF